MLSCVAVYKPNQLFFYSFTQFLNERLRYVSGRPNMAVLKPEILIKQMQVYLRLWFLLEFEVTCHLTGIYGEQAITSKMILHFLYRNNAS